MRSVNRIMVTTKRLISIAILAGGKSSRMGVDKRFLVIRGETFLGRALRVGREVLEVLGSQGQIHVCGHVPGIESLSDRISGMGPLSGIASALEAGLNSPIVPEYILVYPIDMPNLTREDLVALAQSEVHKSALCFRMSELPIRLECTQRVLDQVVGLLAQSNAKKRSLQNLLKLLDGSFLESDDLIKVTHFHNVNSPQDLRGL